MAKNIENKTNKIKKKRPKIHSKKNYSKLKSSKKYKKLNVGQG